jgi:putative sigma-54 modulation protein
MEVEFTARQVRITKALRTQAEEGLERVARVMGKTARASIIFSAERHLQIAELSVAARSQKIVATGKGDTLAVALRLAIEHAESQALRFRDRRLAGKRLPLEEKAPKAPPVSRTKARAPLPDVESEEAKPVRASRTRAKVVQPHVITSEEAFADHPMTIEEAVKELEFRDHDLLIFRNQADEMYVLHRCRNGQIELVEMP